MITFSYDALSRQTVKDIPGGTAADAYYIYDNLGRLLSARLGSVTGSGTINTYDALGRLTSANPNFGLMPQIRNLAYQYDLAGRRTRMTWWDGNYVVYDYDAAGEMTKIRLNGATTGTGVLVTYGYDDLGRRTSLVRGNGTSSAYGYDTASRLTSLSQDLASTANDVTITLAGYNPAGQIGSKTRSNDTYAWTRAYNVDRTYTANGLNQLTASGAATLSYDTRGNLTSDGTISVTYDVENHARTVTQGAVATLDYDALGRLSGTCCGYFGDVGWTYDGDHLMMKTANSNGGVLERYVFGPGGDEPVVLFYSGNVATPRWLHADEHGSIIAASDSTGASIATNAFDDYGIPQNGIGGGYSIGPFGYTGQQWIPEAGLYHYKTRLYSPTLGRFLQTDPIGYGDGMNWYNYVGGDPVNGRDPTGLADQNEAPHIYCFDDCSPYGPVQTGSRLPGIGSASVFSGTSAYGFGSTSTAAPVSLAGGITAPPEKPGAGLLSPSNPVNLGPGYVSTSSTLSFVGMLLDAQSAGASFAGFSYSELRPLRLMSAVLIPVSYLSGYRDLRSNGSSVSASLGGAAASTGYSLAFTGSFAAVGTAAAPGIGTLIGAVSGYLVDSQFRISGRVGDAVAQGIDSPGRGWLGRAYNRLQGKFIVPF